LTQAPSDAEIDRLYGLPLDEFVAQRDALAKSLRVDDREAAAAVKALRKPTAGAWALNQAVRRRQQETKALLTAGERLRAAHTTLLSGGGRDELRAAMGDQRTLAASLADCAEAIASETGKSGPALKERVRSTLHAAALDPEVREQLARGRLVREREAVGLGGAFGESGPIQAAARPAGRPKPERAKAERAEEERAGAERMEAERLLAEAQAARAQAEAAQEDAAERVEAARATLTEAERLQREAAKLLRLRRREEAKRERQLGRLQD
jgi:DNA-binding XRE family transcriptional regulator